MKKILFVSIFLLIAITVNAHYFSHAGSASVIFSNEPPLAGVEQRMQIHIENSTGDAFSIGHEKYFHAIIIGQDLETFTHTHPDNFPGGLDKMDQGTFTLNHTFPKAGTYKLLFDYELHDEPTSEQLNVDVAGDEYLPNATPTFERELSINDYTVTLNAPEFFAGEESQLTYRIQKDGKDVNDLQMHLGTEMHVVIIDTNLENAFHTHAAMPESMEHHEGAQHHFGPTIPVELTFSKPGTYAVFGDFRHDNTVVHTRFFIEANETLAQKLKRSAPYIAVFCAFALALFAIYKLRKMFD